MIGKSASGRAALAAGAALLALTAAGCGGRPTQAVSESSPLDQLFTCEHLEAESGANLRRIEDLRDERVQNRIRTLSRLPGALIGSPWSAIALADPSVAIYREIAALEKRNTFVTTLRLEKSCATGGEVFAAPTPAPAQTPVATPVAETPPATPVSETPPVTPVAETSVAETPAVSPGEPPAAPSPSRAVIGDAPVELTAEELARLAAERRAATPAQ